MMRDYSLATLDAAKLAASVCGIVYTDAAAAVERSKKTLPHWTLFILNATRC